MRTDPAYSRRVHALGIDIPDDLATQWRDWFAPDPQPFLIDAELAQRLGIERSVAPLPDELRDTFEVYAFDRGIGVGWLGEDAFSRLPGSDRTALVRAQLTFERGLVPSVRSYENVVGADAHGQADGHRFVWWPSLLDGHDEDVLRAYVEEGRRPSRHDDLTNAGWDRIADDLPGARALAGTFAMNSGPNCFGTVMAAAGMDGAADVWMLREPFEEWLAEETRPGGRDADPGTVLVWRSPDGLAQHAAVTLGDGWALHKPSQGWMSPRKVLTVDEVKASARARGRRLRRYRMAG